MNPSKEHLIDQLDQLIDHNILASATLCFLAGICLAYGKILATQYYYIALLLTIIFLLFYRKKLLFSRYILLSIFILTGALHQSHFNRAPVMPDHVYHQTQLADEIVLIGIIHRMIVYNGETSRIVIKTEFIREESDENLIPTRGLVQLSYRGKLDDSYITGTKVAVRTKLKRPTGYIGDGVFYYPRFLAQKDIWAKGYIRSALHIYPISYEPTLFEKLRYIPEKLRGSIGVELDILVPEASGLYRAILIGDKSLIENSTLESFKACGIMHILAISGLHMAIVTGLSYGLFLILLRQSTHLMLLYDIRKIAATLTIPLLLFYSLLTGSNAPVIRSFLMAALVMIALCVHRRKSSLPLLSFAALILVAFSPHQLFTASFQLSFAAIGAILFLLPFLKLLFAREDSVENGLYHKIRTVILSSLLISSVACLATLPILLYYFNRFSVISPLTNLLIEPIICLWSLPLGLIGMIFLTISPTIAQFIFTLGSFGLRFTEDFCLELAKFDFIEYWLPTPSLPIIFFYYLILIILLNSKELKLRVLLIFAFSSVLLVLIFSFPSFNEKDEEGRITIIDVGQGSSNLIEFATQQNVLVDCGNMTFAKRSIGEQVVAPMLWKKGIRTIDTIFITHGDSDHYNGLPFIVKQFGVRKIVVADRKTYTENFSSILKEFESLGAEVVTAFTGEIFSFGADNIQCLYNFAETTKLISRDEKNRGLVLRATIHETSILLPGDIDNDAERQLLKIDLDSDLLLASHHGSKTSNSEVFLDTVLPDYLLVSSGVSRKKHFPHRAVIMRAVKRNIPLLATNQHGSLEIIINSKGYKILGKQTRKKNPLLKNETILLAETPHSGTESSR